MSEPSTKLRSFNYRVKHFDKLIGVILVASIIAAPWMVGATTAWGIKILNCFGLGLGLLVGVKKILRWASQRTNGCLFSNPHPTKCILFTYVGICLLLFYVLLSGCNPRAVLQYTYFPGSELATGVEIDYLESILWLPHSYDSQRTFRALWKYVALVGAFVAMRDWIQGASGRQRLGEIGNDIFPSKRMELLLWTFSINAAALALVGMLQRLDGTDKLLWVVRNHINAGQGAFGPFPYQSNGAQFLNLMWPVMLGFWLALRKRHHHERKPGARSGGGPHVMILLFTVLVAAAVVLTQSRAGAFILVGELVAVGILFMFGIQRQAGEKLTVCLLLVSVLAVGWLLGGRALTARFLSTDLENLNGRKLIYEDAGRMVDDFQVLGSGAETFAPLYYFYRSKNPSWDGYVHNDYLETLITFGWVGLGLVVFIFISIWLVPFFGNGIRAPAEFLILVGLAMAGMMAHARYDLPFQIYGLHFEFVLLCAVVTCLKWQKL